jgi:hypothetical protein
MNDFIHKHWLDILMLPANILMVDVVIKTAAEKRGFKQISQICDWVSNVVGFIQDIITGLISNRKPPTPPTAPLVALFIIVACGASYADVSPTVTPTEVINAMGAQAGYFYGVRAGHGYSYLSCKLANLTKNISLDGGLISTSGVALTVDYDFIGGLSLKTFPVLGFFDTFKAGVGGMATDLTAFSDGSQINKVDNRLDFGGDVLFSKKF